MKIAEQGVVSPEFLPKNLIHKSGALSSEMLGTYLIEVDNTTLSDLSFAEAFPDKEILYIMQSPNLITISLILIMNPIHNTLILNHI